MSANGSIKDGEASKMMNSKPSDMNRETPKSGGGSLQTSPRVNTSVKDDAQDKGPDQEGEGDILEEEDPALKDPTITVDGVDMTSGAKLTFTFNEGLVV